MADRRRRDLRRLLETAAQPYGARLVAIERSGSGHLRCTLTLGTQRGYVFTSSSPKDRTATHKVERDAHRALRRLFDMESAL